MSWRAIRLIAIVLFVCSILVYTGLFFICIDCRTIPEVERTIRAPREKLGMPRYVGCQAFAEQSLFDLLEQNKSMTVSFCLSACYQSDYDFALLQNGDTCYCSRFVGAGALQTQDRCDIPCGGNFTQSCGGAAAVSVYSLRIRNGIREWTAWMTMEGSSLHKRYRGCTLNANSTCSVQMESKASGELEDWEQDLKPHFIGCFTSASIIQESVKTIVPVNDWPSNGRECLSHCWWSHVPFAAIVTMGSDRVCVCTATLAYSVPVNTCVDMYGAQVFVLFTYIQANTLRFSAAVAAQRKVLLLGYLQRDLAYVHSLFKSQPKTFYTHDLDLLLKPDDANQDGYGSDMSSSAGFGGSSSSSWEAVVPVHEVLHPYYHCNVYQMPSLFLHWKKTGTMQNSGYSNYNNCTSMVYGDMGYAKCLPFLEEACKMSSIIVGTASALLTQWNLEWFVWHNSDVHIIHVIRDPLQVLMSEDRAWLEKQNVTTTVQRFCSQVLATNDYFQKHLWTRRLHTLFYEEAALSASKVIAFISRKMTWNLTDTTGTTDRAELLGSIKPSSGSTDASVLAPSQLRGSASSFVKELQRQQCAQFYKTFPKRYHAPGATAEESERPELALQLSNKRAMLSNQLKLQQAKVAAAAADRARQVQSRPRKS